MKFYSACFLALACMSFKTVAAQETAKHDTKEKTSTVEKPSRDFVMIKITGSGWNNTPDSVKTKGIGRGFAMSFSYDFPIKKSHFSFAAGLGISAQNVYFDKQNMNLRDTSGQAVFFTSTTYKRYKYTVTRLEAPLELRFFGNNDNRNRGFKAAVGANVGLLLSAHTKGVTGKGTSKYIDKVTSKRFVEQWSFAPTVRIGFGNFSFYGSYSLTPMFKDGQGPEVYPYSIGICLSGL